MYFTTALIATVLAIHTPAFAAPLIARDANATAAGTLKDWNVTSVVSFTPSGRPGSYPWATITANIVDPNKLDLGQTSDGVKVTAPANSKGSNCQAKFFTGGSQTESPLGRTWPCDPTDNGYWTMTVLAGTKTYSSTNFQLKFVHVADVLYQGEEFKASYEATGAFKLGDNLSGTCGGSGVCNWSLKDPITIKPKKQ